MNSSISRPGFTLERCHDLTSVGLLSRLREYLIVISSITDVVFTTDRASTEFSLRSAWTPSRLRPGFPYVLCRNIMCDRQSASPFLFFSRSFYYLRTLFSPSPSLGVYSDWGPLRRLVYPLPTKGTSMCLRFYAENIQSRPFLPR